MSVVAYTEAANMIRIIENRRGQTPFRMNYTRLMDVCRQVARLLMNILLPQPKKDIMIRFIQDVELSSRLCSGPVNLMNLLMSLIEISKHTTDGHKLLRDDHESEKLDTAVTSPKIHDDEWIDVFRYVSRCVQRGEESFRKEVSVIPKDSMIDLIGDILLKYILHCSPCGTRPSSMNYPDRRGFAFKALVDISGSCIPIPNIQASWEDGVLAEGGFGCIRRGQLGGKQYVLKTLRPHVAHNPTKSKKFIRELLLMYTTRHPRILEMRGICYLNGILGMVCDWLPNGTFGSYILKHMEVDIRVLLKQVTEGVSFLHEGLPGEVIIHGDIKSDNILIRHDGSACLCDFGLAKVVLDGKMWTTACEGGSCRWMAPELFVGTCEFSPSSDVYAFGMLMVEAITGKVPWPNLVTDAAIVLQVAAGERPKDFHGNREDCLTPQWKMLITKCWAQEKSQRPCMSEVMQALGRIMRESPASRRDEGMRKPNRFRDNQTSGWSSVPLISVRKTRVPGAPPAAPSTRRAVSDDEEFKKSSLFVKGYSSNIAARKLPTPRVTKSLPVEEYLLRKLRGIHGCQVKALEKTHSVQIQLQDGSAKISGSSPEAVNKAIQEISNFIDFARKIPSHHQDIDHRLQRKINGQLNRILSQTELYLIHIDRIGDNRYHLFAQGTEEQLQALRALLLKMKEQVENEGEIEINMDVEYYELILGDDEVWSIIVTSCGGPKDSQSQQAIIDRVTSKPGKLKLRGDKDLLPKLHKKINAVIKERSHRVLGVLVPKKYQRRVANMSSALCNPNNLPPNGYSDCLIKFPGDKGYYELGSFQNSLSVIADKIIKVSGPYKACRQLANEVHNILHRLRARKCEVDVTWKYSEAVRELLDKEFGLKNIDLDITIPEVRETNSPSSNRTSLSFTFTPVMARAQSNWTTKPRYDDTDKRVCTWILWLDRADPNTTLDEVKSMIQNALSRARRADCIGILTAVEREAFGIVRGRFSQNLWDIEEISNTSISVPRPNSSEKEIVIKGSYSGIHKARDSILALVANVKTKKPPPPPIT